MAGVRVTGVDAVSREIGRRASRASRELDGILRQATEPMLAEARRLCISERVRRALVLDFVKDAEGKVIAIAPDLTKTKIAILIEFGTRPHRQQSWNRRGMISHPGTRARPFLRPAFDGQKGQAERLVGVGLAGVLEV